MKPNVPEKLYLLAKALPCPLYIVGGAVRDALAELPAAEDWDLAAPTDADEVCAAAARAGMTVNAVYRNTGTVNLSDGKRKYEFTSFRTDFYRGGEHAPMRVRFTDDIEEDAKRRDFRCNAVYFDVAAEQFCDPLGGTEDIRARIMRTTREAGEVFSEDGLRLMRLARLSAQLGFAPDENCLAGAVENAEKIRKIAAERIFAELTLLLHADEKYGRPRAQYEGLKILDETRVLDEILPELAAGRGMRQRSDFHAHDVLEHSLRACGYADKKVRLSALLHDIGKPYCMRTNGKYHGHDAEGMRIGRTVLERLKAPKKQAETVARLIGTHMYDLDGRARESKIRAFIQKNHDIYPLILLVKQADYSACKDDLSVCPTLLKWADIYRKMQSEGVPFSLKELKIGGNDLADILPPQKRGKVLAALLAECAYDGRKNDKNYLMAQAARLAAKEE